MLASTLQVILEDLDKLRKMFIRMEQRGDRVPFEAEEKLHEIELGLEQLKSGLKAEKFPID